MTTRQLRRLLPIWTSLLNINDWTIQVRWGTDEEMEGVVGLNFFSPEELQSEILLARGEGEETLIHELLHLVFDGDRKLDGRYDQLHERALNRTAKALLNLRHGTDQST